MMRTVAFLALAGTLTLSAQSKRSMAVEEFEYSTVMTDVQAVFGTQMNIGKGISALMVKRIAETGKFTVVERNRVGTVLKEQDFGASGRVKKGTNARIGQIRGADYTLMGDIVTFGRDDKRAGIGAIGAGGGRIGGGAVSRSTGKAVVTLNFRLVDNESSEIIMTGEARGESKRSSTGAAGGFFSGWTGGAAAIDFSSTNFGQTIIGEAVMDACDKLAAQVTAQAGSVPSSRNMEISGMVASVEGAMVYLNVGSSSGVAVGDKFEISRVLREVRDPATKEVLDVVTEPVGYVTVSTVRDKISMGQYSGAKPAKEGDRAEKK